MPEQPKLAPIVKWVGGKRQLLPEILPLLPRDMSCYCEAFLGGGALLYALEPHRAMVNDLNADIIELYQVVKNDVEGLITALEEHKNAHTEEHFYEVRSWDRDAAAFERLSPVQKAARFMYLNRTCYNGLYRVNSKGYFNSPYGRYVNPNIVNAPLLRAVSEFFNRAQVQFSHEDFADFLKRLEPGSFVYLDPPYDQVKEHAFTSYSKTGFDRADQLRLKQSCDDLTARGIKFLLSNAATPFIQELYQDYSCHIVHAKRLVNSVGAKRGPVEEVLVRNYATAPSGQSSLF